MSCVVKTYWKRRITVLTHIFSKKGSEIYYNIWNEKEYEANFCQNGIKNIRVN